MHYWLSFFITGYARVYVIVYSVICALYRDYALQRWLAGRGADAWSCGAGLDLHINRMGVAPKMARPQQVEANYGPVLSEVLGLALMTEFAPNCAPSGTPPSKSLPRLPGEWAGEPCWRNSMSNRLTACMMPVHLSDRPPLRSAVGRRATVRLTLTPPAPPKIFTQ